MAGGKAREWRPASLAGSHPPDSSNTTSAVSVRSRIEIMSGRKRNRRRAATRHDRCPRVFPLANRARSNRHVLVMSRERALMPSMATNAQACILMRFTHNHGRLCIYC